jgi:hypothetical protein
MSENIVIALVAAGSVVAGSIVTTVGQVVHSYMQERLDRKRDEPRRKLLRAMLGDQRYEWRNLDTLRHVIGADAETAKRLLMEIDARASENGKDLWGLLSRHPLGTDPQ